MSFLLGQEKDIIIQSIYHKTWEKGFEAFCSPYVFVGFPCYLYSRMRSEGFLLFEWGSGGGTVF